MEDADMQTPIPLIVGAGPTGLILSLWLQKFAVPHRIVDSAPSTGTSSRAVVVHARTLELYRQLGLADALIEKGTKVETFAIHHTSALKGRIEMANSGRGRSRYPFILSVTQDEHEALLERTIVERGGHVERNVSVVSVVQDHKNQDSVEVTLNEAGKNEKFRASYVVGCDGAHSVVRHALGIEMQGGTYDRSFFVADVLATGHPNTPGQMNICLSSEDFLMVLPLPHSPGRARLIGFVPKSLENTNPEAVTFADVEPSVRRNAKNLTVEKVNWFSRYKVHHRTAAHFQQGRVFLCGDAAHIHSPVGGQGMNTGLGDASNLGWKLAAVCHGAPAELLETYSAERMPFAKQLVNTTDNIFTKLTGDSYLSLFLRNLFVPYIFPIMLKLINLSPMIFQRVSQLGIQYCDGPMSLDLDEKSSAAAAKAGNRLPWVESVGGDNPEKDNHSYLLETMGWQAHVYGKGAAKWIGDTFRSRGIPLHSFAWNEAMIKAVGLQHGTIYLVRPDGYIGLTISAGAEQNRSEFRLIEYLKRWGVGTVA